MCAFIHLKTTQTSIRKTDLPNRWKRNTYQAASCAIRLFKRGGEADTLTNETQDLLIDILISKIYIFAQINVNNSLRLSIDLLKCLQFTCLPPHGADISCHFNMRSIHMHKT